MSNGGEREGRASRLFSLIASSSLVWAVHFELTNHWKKGANAASGKKCTEQRKGFWVAKHPSSELQSTCGHHCMRWFSGRDHRQHNNCHSQTGCTRKLVLCPIVVSCECEDRGCGFGGLCFRAGAVPGVKQEARHLFRLVCQVAMSVQVLVHRLFSAAGDRPSRSRVQLDNVESASAAHRESATARGFPRGMAEIAAPLGSGTFWFTCDDEPSARSEERTLSRRDHQRRNPSSGLPSPLCARISKAMT